MYKVKAINTQFCGFYPLILKATFVTCRPATSRG